MFLVWSSRARGEPMLPGGYFVSVSATGLVGCCPGWPVPGSMAWWTHGAGSVGKRGMVQAGGSASRTSGNRGTTDPGGGGGERHRPVWVSPVGHVLGSGWPPSGQAFHHFHHWGALRRLVPQGNTNGVTGRRMSWHGRSRDRHIGLFETLRLRWVGVCHRCLPQCPELGGLRGEYNLRGGGIPG